MCGVDDHFLMPWVKTVVTCIYLYPVVIAESLSAPQMLLTGTRTASTRRIAASEAGTSVLEKARGRPLHSAEMSETMYQSALEMSQSGTKIADDVLFGVMVGTRCSTQLDKIGLPLSTRRVCAGNPFPFLFSFCIYLPYILFTFI